MTHSSPTAVTVDTLPVLVHQGVRVVTTTLLAQLYGTAAKNIQDNFANNADRFEPGKHYVKLEGEALREFKANTNRRPDYFGSAVGVHLRKLILWTERGAARHAKMLDTDQAWEVFERLEDAYFRPAASPPLPQAPAASLGGRAIDASQLAAGNAELAAFFGRVEANTNATAAAPARALSAPPDLITRQVRSAIHRKAHALGAAAFEHNCEILEDWLRRAGDLSDPEAAIERIHALDLDHGKAVLVDLQLLHDITSTARSLHRCCDVQMQAIARIEAQTKRQLHLD